MPTITGGSGDDVLTAGASPPPPPPAAILVSATAAGVVQNANALALAISPDGTKVLFQTEASNLSPLVPVFANNLYLKDLITGAVTLVSAKADGSPFGESDSPIFSADGSKVYLVTGAPNLSLIDTDDWGDTFLKDLVTGALTQVSVGPGGVDAASNTNISSVSGTKLLFTSDASNLGVLDSNHRGDVYLLDTANGVWSVVSANAAGQLGNNASFDGVLSPDGTKVAFISLASNLVAGDVNGKADVFVKDLTTGVVTLVSASASGAQGDMDSGWGSGNLQFSADGNKVLFSSGASNLVAGDTNNASDVFIKDLATGAIIRVSTSGAGAQGDSDSYGASFSPDGTKVLFVSNAANLVAGDSNGTRDLFIKDLITGTVTRVPLTEGVYSGRFTPDGKSVVYSTAMSLVAADTNPWVDVYLTSATAAGGGGGGGGSSTTQSYTISGGDGNDTITGANGVDKLSGDAGDDKVYGGGGADQLFGGAGVDLLKGDDGADRLDGGADNDTLYGGAGNDFMDGGSGADTMSGGADNDVYIVDDVNDKTIENAGEGIDVVRASVSWTLSANTENLELQGSGDLNGTGNALANNITGTSGANVLDGGDGGDTLDGGFGNDRLIGGKGNDTMTGGFGADTFVVTGASVMSSKAGGGVLETDFVKDLNKLQGDKLDLSAVDADINTAGDQAFTLVGAFTKHAGEMTLAYTASTNLTVLTLDVDGDGKADYVMKITGDVHLNSGGWIL